MLWASPPVSGDSHPIREELRWAQGELARPGCKQTPSAAHRGCALREGISTPKIVPTLTGPSDVKN